MTAAPWKTRPASRWVLALVVSLSIVAVGLGWWRQTPEASTPRAAYLIATEGEVFTRIGFHTRRIQLPQAVPAGKSVAVPTGKKITVLYPDGRIEVLSGPKRIKFTTTTADLPFLFCPLSQLFLQPGLNSPAAGRGGLPTITSPAGSTRFLNPTLTWETDPGATYDVAIGNPADPDEPPRVAHNVTSPVPFADLHSTLPPQLASDRLLASIVLNVKDPTLRATSRFLVKPDASVSDLPTTPANLILEAIDALTTSPARTGDAWLALSKLPPDWRKSELVVRLRLKAAADLGAVKGYAEARADTQTLVAKR